MTACLSLLLVVCIVVQEVVEEVQLVFFVVVVFCVIKTNTTIRANEQDACVFGDWHIVCNTHKQIIMPLTLQCVF